MVSAEVIHMGGEVGEDDTHCAAASFGCICVTTCHGSSIMFLPVVFGVCVCVSLPYSGSVILCPWMWVCVKHENKRFDSEMFITPCPKSCFITTLFSV